MNGKSLLLPNNLRFENKGISALKGLFLSNVKSFLLLCLLLLASVSFGQSGPVGINAGIDFWLDASDLDADGTVEGASENNLSGGGDVQTWRDKSGLGNHLNAPGNSFDPEYIVMDAAFNNKAVVDFDPGEYLFRNVNDWADTHTVFIVFKQQIMAPAGTGIFASGLASSSGADNIFQICVDTAGTDIAYQTESGGTFSQTLFGTQAAAFAGPTLCTVTRHPSGLVTNYDNGVQSDSMTLATGENIHRYYLNTDKENTSTNDCQIAEIIVYRRVLSLSEMSRIHAYLSCKYGVDFGGAAPGGADPCDVSLWMRADAGTDATAQADPVSTWTDQGTFNFGGTAVGGEEPSFNTMDNNFNPSISFDTTGMGDAIGLGNAVAADGLVVGGGEFSIYSVVSVDTTSPVVDGVLFADNLCIDNNGYNVAFNSATDSWKFSGVGGGGTNIGTTETPNTSSNYSLLKLNRTGADYTAETNENVLSTGMSSGTINFNPTMPTERWIGKEYNASCSSDNFQGKLSELIVIKGAVPAIEDKQIQSYLALKYGLTLPVSTGNYLASDGTTDLWVNTAIYWNNIAGIGQDDGSLLDQRISKSQDPAGIVTIASTNDFTSANNDVSRDSLENGNFLVWGNNGVSASGGWTQTDAPTNFAVIPQTWLVKETGTVGPVSIQVDVNNPNNNIPDGFHGDLFFVHGSAISGATPDTMTETSAGIWTIEGIDLGPNDLFTFAVENKLLVEFSLNFSASSDEAIADAFPTLLAKGIMNIPTTCGVFNSGGGSAGNAGVDYTFDDTTFSVAAGVYDVASWTIDPPLLTNDMVPENLETIIFSIDDGGSNGISVGDADSSLVTFTQHTYTITDDDSYSVSIERVTDGEEGVDDAVFRVFLTSGSNPSATDITGDIVWSGTATGGNGTGDYDNTVTTFTIPPGSLDSTINLSTSLAAYNDNLLEGTETIIGTLENLSSGSVPSPAIATDTAYIIDNEMSDIVVSIDTVANSGTALEGFGFSYRISLANNVINNSDSIISGALSFSGTADPSDYTVQTNFTIPIGNSFTIVNYSATGDNEVELTESVLAQISLLNGVGTTDVASDTARAYILDEDTTGLTMSLSVAGGGAGPTENPVPASIDYNITLDNGKTNGTGAPITGQIAFSGSAIPGTDYTAPAVPFSIPYNAGSVTGTGVYTVTILDDAVPEPTDMLVATISSPNLGAVNPSNNTVSQSIFDDDSPGLQIAIGSPVNAEEGGVPPLDTVYFTISIVAGGVSATDITGAINYLSGTASPVTDFVPVPSYTIPAGQTSTTIALEVIDDGVTEPTETVVALLTGIPSLGSYNNTSSTATILDDDASSLMMSIDTLVGTGYEEGMTEISFVVSLDFLAVNGTGSDIFGTIQFGGSAVNGSDYIGAPVNFNIPNMESSDTIVLTVTDDILLEYTDSIIAVISLPTLGSVSTGSAVAYILDNDLDSLSISIGGAVDGLEDGPASASFVVSIDNGLENGLGVNLTGNVTYSGDAVAGLDFSNVTVFEIPPNSTFVVLDLPVVDDQNLEVTESLIATISDLLIVGSVNLNANVDTAYIEDNDILGAQFAIEKTSDGIESPFPSVHPQFTVSIVGGGENQTGLPITGVLELTGTATEGAAGDYSSTPSPLTTFNIPDSSSGQVIDLLILDDFLEEPTETIIATISSPSIGMISLTDSIATATIADDDTDSDNDGLVDLLDSNDVNIDTDCDGIFDGCDADHDGDGILDAGLDDFDGDGIHDGCDASIVVDGVIDNGPDTNDDDLNDVSWNPDDDDGDLLPNHVDPNDANPDTDGDGIPDGADVDVNGDGVFDNGCDVDDDGINNVADSDDDPTDGQTDVGNSDEDLDGIDNYWDLVNDNAGGQAINYIVSPDGDGVNETLRIKGIDFFDNHELTIFNRWGTPIYRKRNYQQDWAGEITEGIAIGTEPAVDGTYYYTLDLGNGQEFVRGFIEIRR